MTLDELKDEVQEYTDRGFHQDVVNASYEARKAVRLFIAHTHPRTAFGGKALTDGMFIRGVSRCKRPALASVCTPTTLRAGITPAPSGASFCTGSAKGKRVRRIPPEAIILNRTEPR